MVGFRFSLPRKSVIVRDGPWPSLAGRNASRSIDTATNVSTPTKMPLMYRSDAALLPPMWASPPANSLLFIQTASLIPTMAVASRYIARRLSTLPIWACLRAPTNALPNLCVMLLPTETTPETPRFIIPGVMKKAPPLPMKPESTPPMKPSSTTRNAVLQVS